MTRVSLAMKLYFAAVGALALWVGYWGFFVPSDVATAIPWTVPPLHARFLGSMYLSGALMMGGCILARWWCEVRVIVPMIAIWTGFLFLVSLLHLEEFDPALTQTTVWFAAYLVYPLVAIALAVRFRGGGPDADHPDDMPAWLGPYLNVQGTILIALGLLLLLLTQQMVQAWPWKITPLLANLYAAPFLSYGTGSLLLARERAWIHIRIGIAGTLLFGAGVLTASIAHRALFSTEDAAAWLWFGAFAFGVVTLVYAMTPRGHRRAQSPSL
jgi:hypothetical protein